MAGGQSGQQIFNQEIYGNTGSTGSGGGGSSSNYKGLQFQANLPATPPKAKKPRTPKVATGRPDRQTNGQPRRPDEGRPPGTTPLKASPMTNVHQHPGVVRNNPGWGGNYISGAADVKGAIPPRGR